MGWVGFEGHFAGNIVGEEATHGLGGQHQDVDRTPRGRVSQNDRGQK